MFFTQVFIPVLIIAAVCFWAGIKLQEGVSVAGWLPIGTRIMIEGREYVIQDRTAEWVRKLYNGKIIDIYVTDHKAAWNYGNPKKEVWLVE